jgi:hypothetical protein
MDKKELLDIFTREQRIEIESPSMTREVDGNVIRHVSLTGEEGFISYSRLAEGETDMVISAQIAYYEHIRQGFEWKVYDYDAPDDLIKRLRQQGFEIGEPEALMVLDLGTRPAMLSLPVPASVVRITNPGDIAAVVAVENEVWKTDHSDLGEFLKGELREHPETLSVYIAYAGSQPASAAWVYYHPKSSFASLWGGSTLAQYRHQGHYTTLLAARAQEAHSRGFSLLTVDASPMSRPILEKHGFQCLATSTPCKWTP